MRQYVAFLFIQHLKDQCSQNVGFQIHQCSDSLKETFALPECVRTLFINLYSAGCNGADLTGQSGTANSTRCTDRGFVSGSSISGGVVCYNTTTEGSRAVYICIDGFVLMGNETRVCQSDGSWNGSIPQCIPPGMYCRQLNPSTSEVVLHFNSTIVSTCV